MSNIVGEINVTDRSCPSILVLLSDLNKQQVGTKVRFLGCIQHFGFGARYAILQHRTIEETVVKLVIVDFEAVIGTLASGILETGTWINIIGYVTAVDPSYNDTFHSSTKRRRTRLRPTATIQALMAWDAGAVNMVEYEAALKMKINTIHKGE